MQFDFYRASGGAHKIIEVESLEALLELAVKEGASLIVSAPNTQFSSGKYNTLARIQVYDDYLE